MKNFIHILIALVILVSGIRSQQDSLKKSTDNVLRDEQKKEQTTQGKEKSPARDKDTKTAATKDKPELTRNSDSGGNIHPFTVLDVFCSGDRNIRRAGLDDDLIVKVDSLGLMLSRVDEKSGQIILYIENLPLKGLYGIPDVKNSEMLFKLSRVAPANENWNKVLSKPSFFSGSKPVTISIGYENERAIPTKIKDKNFTLVIVKAYWFWLCMIIIVILFIIVYWLGRHTEMLREPFTECEDNGGRRRPYSLALTQMAFWYFLVVSSIILLFLITREFPDLNSTVLILIGISSVTALSSTGINVNKIKETQNKLISLEAEKKTLSESITEIESNISGKVKFSPAELLEQQKDKEERLKRLNEVIQIIPQYKRSNVQYFSKGFLRDLVSDNTGVSLYRFQIAVWTLVLGFNFCYGVWSNLKMPDIDNSLLALMGISSGTYIGFKIPEQKV